MKKLFYKFGSLFAALALVAGVFSTNVACGGPYYQPKVPEGLKKEA